MRLCHSFAVGLLLTTAACGGEAPEEPPVQRAKLSEPKAPEPAAPLDSCQATGIQTSLRASAPMGTNDRHVGLPLDGHFERVAGEQGRTLFPDGEVRTVAIRQNESSLEIIDDASKLDANMSAAYTGFGFGGATLNDKQARFAVYRAAIIVEAKEVDEATRMRTPPAHAKWYLSRVFYGHQYEMIFTGNDKTIGANFAANLTDFGGGNLNKFAQDHQLKTTVIARGLEPISGQPVQVKSPEELLSAYRVTGAPVPILVEYRTIPAGCLSGAQTNR